MQLLSRLSDALVNLVYVFTAFVVVVMPLLGALGTVSLGWLNGVLIAAFVAASAWYPYAFGRDLSATEAAGGSPVPASVSAQRPSAPEHAFPPVPPNATDPLDEHWVILGGLLFFLVMAIFAALGMQP